MLDRYFLNGAPSTVVLGDNIFFCRSLPEQFAKDGAQVTGTMVFVYHTADQERYGVEVFNEAGTVRGILEKPKQPTLNYPVIVLYLLNGHAPELAAQIKPSERRELETVDLLAEGTLHVKTLGGAMLGWKPEPREAYSTPATLSAP